MHLSNEHGLLRHNHTKPIFNSAKDRSLGQQKHNYTEDPGCLTHISITYLKHSYLMLGRVAVLKCLYSTLSCIQKLEYI